MGHRLGERLGYVLVVNTSIGSGYFAIPWAYSRGGWAISLFFQVLFVALGYLLALQVLEILPKARFLYYLEASGKPRPRPSLFHLFSSLPTAPPVQAELEASRNDLEIDMIQVVRLLLGELWCAVYLIVLIAYLEGCLITYVNELGRAACGYWDLGTTNEDIVYRVSVAIYLLVAVYYCHISLEKQITMQVFMWSARIALFVFTLLLSITALSLGEQTHTTPANFSIKKLSQCISVLTLAGIHQFQLPTLLRCIYPMRAMHRRIVLRNAVTLLVVNTLTGVLAGVTFSFVGDSMVGGIRDLKEHHLQHGLIRVFEFLTGILPVFIVISIFPIHLFVTSDNLLSFLYGPNHPSRARPNRRIAIRLLCLLCPFAYCLSSTHLVTNSLGSTGSGRRHNGLLIVLLLHPSPALNRSSHGP